MRCKAFDGLYLGWIWNDRLPVPNSHVAVSQSEGHYNVACHVPTFSMHNLQTHAEPKGNACPRCAEYVRVQLLSRVTELASARTPLTPADAQALLQDLAERSRAVVS